MNTVNFCNNQMEEVGWVVGEEDMVSQAELQREKAAFDWSAYYNGKLSRWLCISATVSAVCALIA